MGCFVRFVENFYCVVYYVFGNLLFWNVEIMLRLIWNKKNWYVVYRSYKLRKDCRVRICVKMRFWWLFLFKEVEEEELGKEVEKGYLEV